MLLVYLPQLLFGFLCTYLQDSIACLQQGSVGLQCGRLLFRHTRLPSKFRTVFDPQQIACVVSGRAADAHTWKHTGDLDTRVGPFLTPVLLLSTLGIQKT